MDEDPTAEETAADDDPDSPTQTEASSTEDASTETETETDTEPADADLAAKASTETASTETEEPPGSDPEPPVSEGAEPDAEDGSSGSPDQAPPKTDHKADERTGPGGVSPTTTTGDPDKDVGGPSVTEESRRQMEGDDALDEPGYGDLGHAEDFRILRDD